MGNEKDQTQPVNILTRGINADISWGPSFMRNQHSTLRNLYTENRQKTVCQPQKSKWNLTDLQCSLLRCAGLRITNRKSSIRYQTGLYLSQAPPSTGPYRYYPLCKHSPTEISIDVAGPGAGLPESVRISPYKRRPRLLTVIPFSSFERRRKSYHTSRRPGPVLRALA